MDTWIRPSEHAEFPSAETIQGPCQDDGPYGLASQVELITGWTGAIHYGAFDLRSNMSQLKALP